VLVPSITYVASFQAITAAGATAMACDVTPERVFIDLVDAERRITEHTRAIMPVHYASDSTDMEAVYRLAERYHLRVIEDAAHAFGCVRDGKMVGAEGDVVCFSFDGIKNITSGEGGAVVTGDQELAKRVRDARLLGVEQDTEKRYTGQRSWLFNVRYQGYRYHMSNLMAAIGREQLKKIERFKEQRRKCSERYRVALSGIAGVELLKLTEMNIVPHIFVIRITNGKRDYVIDNLRKCGIECGMHYKSNHLLEYFKLGYSLPVSELLMEELLTLPLHPVLTDEEQSHVIETFKKALNETGDA
jgi:dTDP-4-amino-4,6-dideoxygalactose transaminase